MSNADPGRARPVFQWLAQLFALMGKESKQIIRDPSSYLVAAILPMIFLLLPRTSGSIRPGRVPKPGV